MDHADLIERVARLEAELVRLREERIPSVDRSSKRRDQRLGAAFMLMAVLVLGLAGLGSASALDGSNTVFTDDIVSGAVTSGKIMDGTVGGVDVKDGTITTTDIYDGTVRGTDVKNETLTAADLAAGTVGSSEIADGTINSADVANGGLTGADIDLTNDNQCNGETVQGTALVDADPNVPNAFTTNWLAWQHSCSGAQVEVRRVGIGWYELDFHSPSRLAVATGGPANLAFASTANTVAGQFYVYVSDASGAPQDYDFTVLAY